MKKLYSHYTPIGTFYICIGSRVYFALLDNKLLDSYSTPEQVARELADHPGIVLPAGITEDDLSVPDNLRKWRKL